MKRKGTFTSLCLDLDLESPGEPLLAPGAPSAAAVPFAPPAPLSAALGAAPGKEAHHLAEAGDGCVKQPLRYTIPHAAFCERSLFPLVQELTSADLSAAAEHWLNSLSSEHSDHWVWFDF